VADTLAQAGVRLDREPGPITSKNFTPDPLYHSAKLVPAILTVRVLLKDIEVRPREPRASGVAWR